MEVKTQKKTRKITQHKINPRTGRLQEYYVDIPIDEDQSEISKKSNDDQNEILEKPEKEINKSKK